MPERGLSAPPTESSTRKASPSLFRQDLARYRLKGKLQWHDPSLWAVAVYRLGQWCRRRRPRLLRRLLVALHTPLFAAVTLVTGVHLPRGARIGGGLRIWHFGCVVLHPSSVIGRNCTLRHGVTIGNRGVSDQAVPTIGDDVDIGSGAKLLGAIRIGNRVVVGANAVVLRDVPDDHLAVGVPARVLPRKQHG